ncbi:MAG: hypothetical protein LBQ52_08155 [Helicobacteraceae bacterium]|jgi:hypothetical protein|nr:hypothetical protein [Helicobacteraceae bacterium]
MSAFHCKSASISCLPKKRDKVKVFYQSSLFIWFFGFALFALSGCYSEKKGEAEHNNVSFYDDNLDVLETRSIMRGTTINPSNIRSGSWYKAGENASTTSHQLRGDVNFYASPSVFEINDESGLKEVNATCGTTSKHILLNDIALTSEWKPLCSAAADKRFVGILNGNARKITGLQIDSDENYIGLFKYIGAYGVVKNLGVIIANDKEINGSQYVGAIAGYIDGGLVENSYAEGNVSGAYGYIGGIAGYVNVGSIKRSYSEGNVSGSGSGIGGLVGRLEGSSIADSYSKGYIAGYGDNNQMVGGIAGQAYGGGGSIKRSYSEGNVSGAQRIGGIAGYIDGATIENVYSVGDVDGNNSVGGIAGYVNVGSIRYSYSEGNVSGDGNVSGIVGYIYSGAISNNAAINEKITGNADVNRIVGNRNSGTVDNNFALETMIVVGSGANGNAGTNKPQAQLKTREAYENATNNNGLGWKFGNDDESPWVWGAFSGYPYPTLYWQTKSLSRY